MTVTLDSWMFLFLGAAALGLNVVFLLLMVLRPAGRGARAESGEGLARAVRGVLAEAISAFALALAVLLLACAPAFPGVAGTDALTIALVKGLLAGAVAAAFASCGAGHANPAVTLGLAMAGRVHPVAALCRVAAQCGAALGAAFLLVALFDASAPFASLPVPAESVPFKAAFLLEAIAAALLVAVVVAVGAKGEGGAAGLATGGAVAALSLALGPFTGAGLNPALYVAVALPNEAWDHVLIYAVAPLIGGSLAAVFVEMFVAPARTDIEEAAEEDADLVEARKAA